MGMHALAVHLPLSHASGTPSPSSGEKSPRRRATVSVPVWSSSENSTSRQPPGASDVDASGRAGTGSNDTPPSGPARPPFAGPSYGGASAPASPSPSAALAGGAPSSTLEHATRIAQRRDEDGGGAPRTCRDPHRTAP